ncbi:MAG: hypothetical protein IT507_17935 [Burkholderiaceae bacterium]|nr:hypothetical protein [Burkholderiaceae bacterium]
MYLEIDDYKGWCDRLAPWLNQRFHPAVLERFYETVHPDWLTWLDAQQAAHTGTNESSNALFAPYLHGAYEGVRVIHATRLPNLEIVRDHGLRAWSPDELRKMARQAFGGEAERVALEESIEKCLPDHRGGAVYSFASLSHALGGPDSPSSIPEFASEGGEFLRCVGLDAGLGRTRVRSSGQAYLFACDIPWQFMSEELVGGIAEDILRGLLVWRFFDVNSYSMLGSYVCISTSRNIPPERIQFVADVEHLVARTNVRTSEIRWERFGGLLAQEAT